MAIIKENMFEVGTSVPNTVKNHMIKILREENKSFRQFLMLTFYNLAIKKEVPFVIKENFFKLKSLKKESKMGGLIPKTYKEKCSPLLFQRGMSFSSYTQLSIYHVIGNGEILFPLMPTIDEMENFK